MTALRLTLRLAAGLAVFTLPLWATVDRNGDGISDIWWARYPSAGFPQNDPDDDGATNLEEARAGTDPLNRLSHLASALQTDASGNLVVRWPSVAGKHYRVEASTDLQTWTAPFAELSGTGSELSVTVRTATATTQREFWRVVAFDADADSDGLSDWEEALLGTNPNDPDTNHDGRPDAWEAPVITTQPQNTTVTSGQTATFTVAATGTPTPTYQWRRNGTSIPGATAPNYTTPPAAATDDGTLYSVVVSNSAGPATSTNARLTVNAAPVVTTQPQNATAPEGGTATFTVITTDKPTPSYQWKKNGLAIDGAIASSYTTPATTVADTGARYSVEVTNALGSTTSTEATLTVLTQSAVDAAVADRLVNDAFMVPFYTSKVFPTPQSVVYDDALLPLNNVAIVAGPDLPNPVPMAQLLIDRIQKYGGSAALVAAPTAAHDTVISIGETALAAGIAGVPAVPARPQAYIVHPVTVGPRTVIVLKAADHLGFTWAIGSLGQLVHRVPGSTVARKVFLVDYPSSSAGRGYLHGNVDTFDSRVTAQHSKLYNVCFKFDEPIYKHLVFNYRWTLGQWRDTDHWEAADHVQALKEQMTPYGIKWIGGLHAFRGSVQAKGGASPEDIRCLTFYAQAVDAAGGRFYLQADDYRYDLNLYDEAYYKAARWADKAILNSILSTLKLTNPGARMMFCPVYYWSRSGSIYVPDESAGDYNTVLRDEVTSGLDIQWTGTHVKSSPSFQSSYYTQAWAERIGRKPSFWQNTYIGAHADPTSGTLYPGQTLYWEFYRDFIKEIAHFGYNGAVPVHYSMNAAIGGYMWNSESYVAEDAAREIAAKLVGHESLADLATISSSMLFFDQFLAYHRLYFEYGKYSLMAKRGYEVEERLAAAEAAVAAIKARRPAALAAWTDLSEMVKFVRDQYNNFAKRDFAEDLYAFGRYNLTIESSPVQGVPIVGANLQGAAEYLAPISGTTSYTNSVGGQSWLTLLAPPTDGARPFVRWRDTSGTTLSSNRLYSFERSGDTTVIAEYDASPGPHTLSVHAESVGQIAITGTPAGVAPYSTDLPAGTTVTLTAPGTDGSHSFRRWKDAAGTTLTTSATYSFNLAADSKIVAEYRQNRLFAWGRNASGELGDGTTTAHHSPVLLDLANVTQVTAGQFHSLAVLKDGTLWAWGNNRFGQLGINSHESQTRPALVPLAGVVATAAGSWHSIALKADGTVHAWGENSFLQLGNGNTWTELAPVQTQGISNVVAIASGWSHVLAIRNDRSVWAWGRADRIQNLLASSSPLPQLARNVPSSRIAAGGQNSIIQQDDDTLIVCGDNSWGQFGMDAVSDAGAVPVSGLTGIIGLAAGEGFFVALKSDGTVLAWGFNAYGQLGDGTTQNRYTPQLVPGLTNVVQIAAGDDFVLARLANGTVKAWGSGGHGQLGLGEVKLALTPTLIPGLTGITSVSAGGAHAFAIANP